MKRVAILLVLLACTALAHAQTRVGYTVVLPEGKRVPLQAYRLNGRDYAPFTELLRSFFRGGSLADNRTIEWKEEELRTAPASFYLVRSSNAGMRMAQMPYPVLELNGELCLPLLPLCSAVEALGLYETDVRGTVITLRRFSQQATAVLFSPSVYGDERSEKHDADIITGLSIFSDEEADEDAAGTSKAKLPPPARKKGGDLSPVGDAATRVGAIAAPLQVPDEDHRTPAKKKQNAQKQIRSTPQEAPVDTTDTQPGRYNLPPDLYRRELLDDSPQSWMDMPLPEAGPPVASLFWPEPAAADIVSMDVSVRSGVVDILVAGSGSVENYQRPECSGRQLVLRFPGAHNAISAKALRKLGTISPVVSVRSEQIGAILVYKITFAGNVEKCTSARRSSSRLLFSVHTATSEATPPHTASSEAQKWALDIIVLDAGHGGKDVGAIGVTGCYEKDITLAIVKKLGALIEKNLPQTKVVYTRKDDRFVELYRRGQIANEAGGKLFISVHCNSMPSKPHPAKGFETYILRPGRNEDAVRVAERENDAIRFESNQKRYKALTDEQFIVVNMAQSAFVKFSEMFAAAVQDEVGKATSLASRGVNQAGFYVLVGASMPNILFETAFLSNKDDEKFINSERGQNAVARGLFNAIRIYADKYEQMIEGQK